MQTEMINQIPFALLQMLFFNSLLIVAIQSLTHDPHPLSDVAAWLNKRPARVLFKPLFLCLRCMSSVWGALFFVATHGFFIPSLPNYFLFVHVLLLLGVMVVIDYLFTFLNK
jgi:hypothetical protein